MREIAKARYAGSFAGAGRARRLSVALALAIVAFALSATTAGAKEVVFFIGAEETGASTATGEFSTPLDTAANDASFVDSSDGDIYVADFNNHRVQRFSSTGEFELMWGKDVFVGGGSGFEICTAAQSCKAGLDTGDEKGELDNPTGIAVGQSDGSVYVWDRDNNRIQKFDRNGNFILAFGDGVNQTTTGDVCTDASGNDCQAGVAGAGAGAFGATTQQPRLAIDPDAPYDAFVADPTNRRVQRFEADGDFVSTFGAAANFGTNQPLHVAVDRTENIVYASDSNTGAQIDRYDLDTAAFTTSIGAPPLLVAGATGTAGLEVDPDSDGLGSDVDRLLVLRDPTTGNTVVQEIISLGGVPAAAPGVHGNGAAWTGVTGLGLNASSGHLYVSRTQGGHRVYALADVEAPEATIDPVTDFDFSSATLTGEVDPNKTRTDYRFEYSTDDGLSWTCLVVAGCADEANLRSAGSGDVPVEVGDEAHLTPETTYQVRLVAIKPFGAGEDIAGPVEFSTPASAPSIVVNGAAPLGETTARLTGGVNPNLHSTDAHFEYGTAGDCESNPCVSTPVKNLGSGFIPHGLPYTAITEELTGLQPATTYHFRLVATSTAGTAEGPDRTFTTLAPPSAEPCLNEDVRLKQHSTYLSDCRAFELINDPDKGNQHAGFSASQALAPGGDGTFWEVAGGAPGSNTGAISVFTAERNGETPHGWESEGLAPPAGQQVGGGNFAYKLAEPQAAGPDFSRFISLVAGPSGGTESTLVRLDSNGGQEILRSYPGGLGATKHDMTDDADHVVLINPETPGTIPNTGQLEDVGAGVPEVVSIMPDGTESECGLRDDGSAFVGIANTAAGTSWHPGYHRIASTDASRIYFQAPANGDCGGLSRLWARDREAEETIEIDPGAGSLNPGLIRVTPDGGSAYFSTLSDLDPSDEDDSGLDGDVYRWDEGTGESTCLTCEAHPEVDVRRVSAGSLAAVLLSDDFSSIYFESEKQLVPGRGTEGETNLYVLSAGTIRFVANPNNLAGVLNATGEPPPLLSADGSVLVFGAEAGAGLTTDSIAAECPGQLFPVPCVELYRYEREDESIECISCRRGGLTSHAPKSSAISSDGSTVAFSTTDALVSSDVNQDADVYRWRDGSARLVTDGVTDFPETQANIASGAPRVSAIDADGSDIFITVAQPGLTGFEQDGLANAYTARIGGGFVPPPATEACIEDSCQGPLQPAPSLSQPGTSVYNGPGNLTEARPRKPCAGKRGKAKRRCLKKRRSSRKARATSRAGVAK